MIAVARYRITLNALIASRAMLRVLSTSVDGNT
jgi:hypothetical protein